MIQNFTPHMRNSKKIMKNKLFKFLIGFVFISYAGLSLSVELASSVWEGVGEGAHGNSGVLIIALNKETGVLTGYYEANDTTGRGTNECKMYFSGEANDSSLEVSISDADKRSFAVKSSFFKGRILFRKEGGRNFAVLYPKEKSWSCEWMYDGLPSYLPPKNFSLRDGLKFGFVRNDDFIAVGVVKANRANFYAAPDELTIRKAFLVAGDFIYVFAEKHDWYYVRFQGKKKETMGWIKKTDTIQFDR